MNTEKPKQKEKPIKLSGSEIKKLKADKEKLISSSQIIVK